MLAVQEHILYPASSQKNYLDFNRILTSIYASNSKEESEQVSWKVGSVRDLFNGPCIVYEDFNIINFFSEKKNYSRITKYMIDLFDFIEDMGLMDFQLA